MGIAGRVADHNRLPSHNDLGGHALDLHQMAVQNADEQHGCGGTCRRNEDHLIPPMQGTQRLLCGIQDYSYTPHSNILPQPVRAYDE